MPSKLKKSIEKVPTPTEKQSGGYIPDWMQNVAAGITRVAAPWIGSVMGGTGGAVLGAPAGGVGAVPTSVAGAAAGGAAGGAVGETLAQLMEPGGINRGV